MADAQLAQIVVHRHPGQGAEMLAQRALAALFLLAEFLQYKVFIQAARKPGDELIQQRFLRCGGGYQWRNDGASTSSPAGRKATPPAG